MRNLLLSSFVLLILTGCKLGHYSRLKEATGTKTSLKPVFGDNFNSFLFKTNIHIYGKDFSGLLVTKQLQPKEYRVIFTTELGMKIFDFEFKDTSFTLHYCVPQFNKPKLLKVIRQDIETLLMNNLEGRSVTSYTEPKEIYHIQRIQLGNYNNYYFTEKTSQQLLKIEHSKKRTIKTIFTLNDYKDGFPSNIIIQHYNIQLRIELNLLKK